MRQYRLTLALALLLLFPALALPRQRVWGFAEQGNGTVAVNGIPATVTFGTSNRVMRSWPLATITIYAAGTTTLSTIFSDNAGTSKANPFTADSNGYWFFYADNGHYDVKISGGGTSATYTLGDNSPFDSTGIIYSPCVTPPYISPLTITEVGATGDHHTHRPTGCDFAPATTIDLSADTNKKQALYINTKTKTNPAGTKQLTGIYIDHYSWPDNGGDTSGIHVVSTGSSDAGSFFAYKAERPPGYTLQTGGAAIEASSDGHSDVLFLFGQDNATDSILYDGRLILARIDGTGVGATGLYVANRVATNPAPPDSQVAILVATDTGTPRFRVQLNNGNIDTYGNISAHTTNLIYPDSNDRGVFWTMPAGNQAFVVGTSTNTLDLRGGTLGFRILNNASTFSNLQMLDSGNAEFRGTVTFDSTTAFRQSGQWDNNKLVQWTKSGGTTNNPYIVGNTTDYLELKGQANGVRFVNNASTVTTFSVSDAGNVFIPLGAEIGGTAPTVAAGEIGLGGVTSTTVGAAGGASALPATPTGYITINVGGTNRKVAFYAQ